MQCGKTGHLSRDCQSPPLPADEQAKLREKHLRPRPQPVNMMEMLNTIKELDPEELGVVHHNNDPPGTMTMPVSMLEAVRGRGMYVVEKSGNYQVAGKMGNRLVKIVASMTPQDRTAWIAAAEKRNREVRGEEKAVEDERHRKIRPREQAQVEEEEVAEEDTATPMEEVEASGPVGQPFIPDPKYATPEALRAFQEQEKAFIPAASAKKKSTKKNKDKVPQPKKTIRMMQGRLPWDALEALRKTPVVGLDWGSFLSLAPSVKADMCKGLVLVKPGPVQFRGASNVEIQSATRPNMEVVEAAAIQKINLNDMNMGFLYGNAIPEPVGPILNFYSVGTVTNQVQGQLRAFRIPKVLIDGGAVVNLMPESVVRKLGLPYEDNDDIIIRTATNKLHPVLKRTHFNIDVGGVLALV